MNFKSLPFIHPFVNIWRLSILAFFLVFTIKTDGIAQCSLSNLSGNDQLQCTYDASKVNFAVNSSGKPYILFSDPNYKNRLSVRTFNGSFWEYVGSPAFSDTSVMRSDLVIDKQGNLYVSYYVFASNKISIKKYDGTSWNYVGGLNSINGYNQTRLALDTSDTPYILYQDANVFSKISVRKFNGSSWVLVGNAGFSASNVSFDLFDIAISKSNQIYVAYTEDNQGYKTYVRKFNGTSWAIVGNASVNAVYSNTQNIVIDSNEIPYVSYTESTTVTQTKMKKYNGTAWVDIGSTNGYYTTGIASEGLTIDKNNDILTVFRDPAYLNHLCVYKYNGTSWAYLGNTNLAAGHDALVDVDSSGKPYLCYLDSLNLKNTVRQLNSNNVWDSVGFVNGITDKIAEEISLACDKNGVPYLAYSEKATGFKARLKKFDGASWVNVGPTLATSAAASYFKLGLDSSSNVYIAYQDAANANKASLVKFNGNTWSYLGNPGFSNNTASSLSFCVNDAGTPFVAYHMQQSNYSEVKQYNGSQWVNILAFGSNTNGMRTDMTIHNNLPALFFADNSNGFKATVKWYNGSNWITIGTPGFSAGLFNYPCIVSKNGIIYVAYRDNANANKCTVQKFDGSSWVVLGSAGFSAGSATEINVAVNNNGKVMASYIDSSLNSRVMLMEFDGTNWINSIGNQTLSAGSSYYSEMVMDTFNQPIAVYNSRLLFSKRIGSSNNAPGVVNGNVNVCSGTTQTYNISAIPNALSYQWILPPGWSGSSNSNSITTVTGANSGNVSVAYQDSCGLSAYSVLNVTISAPTITVINDTVCNSYTLNGQTYTSSGSYTQTLQNALGCDSIINLNLTIINANINQVGATLSASQLGLQYQWLQCPSMNPILGATSSIYNATVNGDYALIISYGGCSDTSSCVNVTSVKTQQPLGNKERINIYPNPIQQKLNIDLENVDVMEIEIYNSIGQKVMTLKCTQPTNAINLDVSQLSIGSYLLKIISNKEVLVSKFQKN